MNNSKQDLGRGIATILMANIINVVFSLVTNFVLPKYLSIESYAIIKTFQLYLMYVGLFHLGYSDGMYLRYGGKDIKKIDKCQFGLALSTMRTFQLIMTVVVLMFSLLRKNVLLSIFSLDLLGFNLMGYFKSMFQAVGEYKKYANVTNIVAALNFVFNMTLIVLIRTDNPYLYVICYSAIDIFIWVLLEVKIRKLLDIKLPLLTFSLQEFLANIKEGLLLLLGNLISVFLTSMDRWFIKILLTTVDFAQYSFAVTVENFLNVVITPITITLYNYFRKHPNTEQVRKLKNYITLLGACLMIAFFPVKFILEIYLTKYIDTVPVIAFLFASQMFYLVIKSIYINLYKAKMQQKKYFMGVLIIIVVGFTFNVVMFLLNPQKESFAMGTLCSAIVWFFVCQIDFKELRSKINELIYIMAQLIVFLVCALYLKSLIGLVVYLLITVILAIVLMRGSTIELFDLWKNTVKKILRQGDA